MLRGASNLFERTVRQPISTIISRLGCERPPEHYAYVKISEGCDYPCTFCIIPKIRGAYRSRTPESILAEAETLAAQNVRELVLIAQDTTRYGDELGMRHGLADLLRQLARVDGIEWVRFLYAYPTTVDDAVLQAMADELTLAATWISLCSTRATAFSKP